jgi:phosphoserine phosphatase
VLEIVDGHLTGQLVDQPWGDICDGAQKRHMVVQTCAAIGATLQQAIAVGDGANDLPMMNACAEAGGLSVAYCAKPAVRAQAMLSIDSAGLEQLLRFFD